MFGFSKKVPDPSPYSAKILLFARLLENHPLWDDQFFGSLSAFVKIFEARYASVYLFEPKTNTFLLKKWYGHEPSRFSIVGDYEFLEYVKKRLGPVYRSEFADKRASEMRQAALFYYQQTLSNIIIPIREREQWIGLLNFDTDEEPNTGDRAFFDFILVAYADAIKRWLTHQQILHENKRLSSLSDIKNQLLANVTHELQTPLNGILGMTEALLDNAEVPVAVSEPLQHIRKAGRELAKTVENLLNLVQIEARKANTSREKLSILPLIKEVALLFSEPCERHHVKLTIPCSVDDIFIFVNADQIRTVLMNLIGNAVKFTAKGEIRVEVKKSGETLHVSVMDTGIGIDDEKLGLIFEEFYQADGARTRLYGGTGLGLAIAKKIVHLHGGRIWVESQKGQGSCFTFSLPRYPV